MPKAWHLPLAFHQGKNYLGVATLNALHPISSLQSAERRASQRTRLVTTGKILYGDFSKVIVDCMIRDISDGGARVETEIMMLLPEFMDLQIGSNPKRPVRYCWALGHAIGFEFLDTSR